MSIRPAVRERILELAAAPEGITSPELAWECYLTDRTAQRYLHTMEQEGLIIAIGTRTWHGRGRKPFVYKRTMKDE